MISQLKVVTLNKDGVELQLGFEAQLHHSLLSFENLSTTFGQTKINYSKLQKRHFVKSNTSEIS